MLFGMKLATGIYEPWKESYVDYDGLKELLKEIQFSNSDKRKSKNKLLVWSDNDESKFVERLDNELEKVYSFQSDKYHSLLNRLNKLEEQLTKSLSKSAKESSVNFEEFKNNLENILTEANELDNFTRLNYTGFIKIVKKHDKLHPQFPSVKSLLEVRLKKLPLHTEEYSPLLYQISYLYNIIRNSNDSNTVSNSVTLNYLSNSVINDSNINNNFTDEETFNFKSLKFWVHEDNLMEVKTRILRHLPVLLYASAPSENDGLLDGIENDILLSDRLTNTSSTKSDTSTNNRIGLNSKDDDRADAATKRHGYDPVINTLYFDNESFELYNDKLLKTKDAPTLRLRWVGQLYNNPDIFLEKRTVSSVKSKDLDGEVGDLATNVDFEELRIKLKEKYINDFIFNEGAKFKDQAIKKLAHIHADENKFNETVKNIDTLQNFIVNYGLQPVLRTTYTRTAFQIPGDDRVRVTIDSDILYIREDSLDKNRPIRNEKSWHRTDIDSNIANPMKFLRTGEYTKFPFAVMEIKIKNDNFANLHQTPNMASSVISSKMNKKHNKWIYELTNSHLVKEVSKFSKYVQGIASLFGDDDKLDVLPFWLPSLETDIRKGPKEAYEEEILKEEKQKKIQLKLDEMRKASSKRSKPSGRDSGVSSTEQSVQLESSIQQQGQFDADLVENESSDEEDENRRNGEAAKPVKKNLKRKQNDLNFLQFLSGRDAKLNGFDSENEEIDLPPGVIKPKSLIKNAGPIKVEAKVWLANERTFNRWLKVTTMFSILTFSIYNSVKNSDYPKLADTLAYIYFGLTLFCGIWSYIIYLKRLNVIKERSGEHLDAPLGPIIVALVLSFTLIVNFVVAFKEQAKNQYAQNSLEAGIKGIKSGSEVFTHLPLSEKLLGIQNLLFSIVGAATD